MARKSWETDKAAICEEIRSSPSPLKIVLKTKNEAVLLNRWIRHHRNIVDPSGIIIFDNGSNDRKVLKALDNAEEGISVYSFSAMHNLIHYGDGIFKDLFSALRESAKYYTFIDTDEFLYWADADGSYIDDSRFVDRVVASDALVIPGIWARNIPGLPRKLLLSFNRNRMGAGIKSGKPIFSNKIDLHGLVNHNIQLPAALFEDCKTANVVVGHLVNFSAEQRIAANIEKLKSYTRVTNVFGDANLHSDAITLEVLLAMDVSKLTGNTRHYVEEVQRLASATESSAIPDDLAADRAVAFRDGLMKFANAQDRAQILAFLSDPAPTLKKLLYDRQ